MLDLTGENDCSKVVVGLVACMINLRLVIVPGLVITGAGDYHILCPANSMIHHKVSPNIPQYIVVTRKNLSSSPYGVSQSHRVLSPGLFLKCYDRIRDCLDQVLGLTVSQREVVLRLLWFWAYYGQVYPKEATITEMPGCSKATFWRTIKTLRERNLVHVINRFVVRPHAQISNLYRLDRLCILLARYLAEHGHGFLEKWLRPALTMPGRLFWSQIYQTSEARAGPGGVEFADS
ncbi:hypothetical protein ES703_100547 [subsurface metagenome]